MNSLTNPGFHSWLAQIPLPPLLLMYLCTTSYEENSGYVGQEELVKLPEKLKRTLEQAQGQKRELQCSRSSTRVLLITTVPESHFMVLAAF